MTETIGGYEVHPAANLFPRATEREFLDLVESIKKNGLINPVVLYDGMILDGRNRAEACVGAKVEIRTVDFEGDGNGYGESVDNWNPWIHVWALNAERRHLTPGQKAALAVKCLESSEEWKKKEGEVEEAANRARSETQKGIPKAEAIDRARSPERKRIRSDQRDRKAKEIAATAKVSTSTVKRVIRLKKENPDTFEAVAKGEALPTMARRRPRPPAEKVESCLVQIETAIEVLQEIPVGFLMEERKRINQARRDLMRLYGRTTRSITRARIRKGKVAVLSASVSADHVDAVVPVDGAAEDTAPAEQVVAGGRA
jgi:hypothetical protein